jgi:hypothetical protein
LGRVILGALSIKNSTLESNSASLTTRGGGAIFSSGLLIINACAIRYNASDGNPDGNGGVGFGSSIISSNSLSVTNSLISGNHSEGGICGIAISGTATITSSMITKNSSDGFGAGIYNDGQLTIKTTRSAITTVRTTT